MWGERAWGGGSASGVHGEGPTQGCAESKGGHAMRGEVRVQQRAACGRGVSVLGDGDASGMDGDGLTQGCGGQGTCGAHFEHLVHGRDLGRVEAERLVERRRFLPSRKVGM